MRDSEFNHWVKETITGDIDNKITYLKRKSEGKFTDDYYYLTAVSFDDVYTGPTNNISDPVGGLASRLADLKLSQKRNYLYFKTLKEVTLKTLMTFEPEQLQLIKIYLNLDEGYLRNWEKYDVRKLLRKIKDKFVKEKIYSKWADDPDQENKKQEKSESEIQESRLSIEEAQEQIFRYR